MALDPAPLAISISRGGAPDTSPTVPQRSRFQREPYREEPAQAPPAVALEDFERIEDYLRAYLESERFRSSHPLACGRWLVAWEMLWCADSRAKVLAVGGRADAAMGAFAISLLERDAMLASYPQWPDLLADGSSPAEPLEILSAFTSSYRTELGEERRELLEGLFEHWRALAEAMRRHREGAPGTGERVRWEDGRRLALFTALVMVEIDRSLG
jgi:hypothetical protein